jgi:hypothetical protein
MYYEISYAYPSSLMAKQLHKEATGCYYVTLQDIDNIEVFNSLPAAIEYAESTGYLKSKYSM